MHSDLRYKYLAAHIVETDTVNVNNSIKLNGVKITSDNITNTLPAPTPKLPIENGSVITDDVDGTVYWTRPVDLVSYDQTFHGAKFVPEGNGVGLLFSITPALATPDSLYIEFHAQGFENNVPFIVRTDIYATNTTGTWTVQTVGAGFISPGPSSPINFTVFGTQIICTLAESNMGQRNVTWHMSVDSYSNQHVTYTPL